jgi:hypothetical protein
MGAREGGTHLDSWCLSLRTMVAVVRVLVVVVVWWDTRVWFVCGWWRGVCKLKFGRAVAWRDILACAGESLGRPAQFPPAHGHQPASLTRKPDNRPKRTRSEPPTSMIWVEQIIHRRRRRIHSRLKRVQSHQARKEHRFPSSP